MLRDIKDIIFDYAIIGGTMALMTGIIRPYKSAKQLIKDSCVVLVASVLVGLLIEYWSIPYYVKCGLSGLAGLFAVNLYAIAESVLSKVAEHPELIIDRIKDKKDDK